LGLEESRSTAPPQGNNEVKNSIKRRIYQSNSIALSTSSGRGALADSYSSGR